MKFPIDIIKIDRTVYLLQGEITQEFIDRLNTLNRSLDNTALPNAAVIRSVEHPQLRSDIIYINGSKIRYNYQIVCRVLDNDNTFIKYKNAIELYKGLMGYE